MSKRIDKYLYYALAVTLALLAIFPVYWTFISSIKTPPELINPVPSFFPNTVTLEYYRNVWNLQNISDAITIGGAFRNSVIVSVGTICVSLTLCTLTGYSLATFDFRFKELCFILLILPILVPTVLLVVPLFSLLKSLGLLDTYLALILIHSVGLLPLGTFIMRNAFESIPKSLREIAIVEGSSELRIITTVLLPLALPGLLTLMIFALWTSWNDYLMAFIFTSSPEKTMLNVALARIATGSDQFEMKWGNLTAGSMISFIPIIVFYIFLQKYFVRGVTGGAVKE